MNFHLHLINDILIVCYKIYTVDSIHLLYIAANEKISFERGIFNLKNNNFYSIVDEE